MEAQEIYDEVLLRENLEGLSMRGMQNGYLSNTMKYF